MSERRPSLSIRTSKKDDQQSVGSKMGSYDNSLTENEMRLTEGYAVNRRGSTTAAEPISSVTFSKETEMDILKKCIIQDPLPRWSTDLSVEAKYAIFKGYSELLKENLNKKLQNDGIILSTDIEAIPENLYQKVNFNMENLSHKLKEYEAELENSIHPKTHASDNPHHNRRHRNSESDNTVNDDVFPEDKSERDLKIQLLLSRYLQYAHAMVDCTKEETDTAVRSSKGYKKLSENEMDYVQLFETWNNRWNNFFKLSSHSKLMF